MGNTYSVNGFINAALRRTGRTLLVEGVTDKNFIHRVCVESGSLNEAYVVDHAGLLSEVDCGGLGNRARVLKVREVAKQLSETIPKINEVLAVLVDREWEGLPAGEGRLSNPWQSPAQENNGYTTLGHSIENYCFNARHVSEYLKFGFSDVLKPGFLRLIGEEFQGIVGFAACLSMAFQEHELLSRSAGLLTENCFDVTQNGLRANATLVAGLVGRGVSQEVSQTLIDRANCLADAYGPGLSAEVSTQWLPHGHLGQDVVWAGVAAYALSIGVPQSVCGQIVGAGKVERQRFMAHLVGNSSADEIFPLKQIADWLVA